ncbi:SNO glutamine amidotransferase [Colletotrichum higginsianum IMI 349063]|uniref:glutaminase n=3 Tax=Colletotrichum higginsianum TaxID=80884 RepID=A0A1B7YWX8_COLHI|nr:SNO glutamine amidotransferase [Colletotrichum higginsianum IMI 349063]OBR16547.1 SNO glutamine amidotransferase [Colletotrichum higginsianum IMI 349063]TID05152.1 putative pyridoxal 5'-phosphate synthase subunit PDX2 [Colletotrichum higginsianum]
MSTVTVGVLALQGGFHEHVQLTRKAAAWLATAQPPAPSPRPDIAAIEVRTEAELRRCDALIIPGGESTTISFVATQSGLMEPLREFVKVNRKPVWGTCAGAILLADEANATKKGGQELIGGLGVRVHRNHFGRQIESFVADLDLPFLTQGDDALKAASSSPYPGVFIRAPIVEEILSTEAKPSSSVEVLAVLPGRKTRAAEGVSQSTADDSVGDIVAVRQANIFATSFHPELTDDIRIHAWWLLEVLRSVASVSSA